MWAQISNSLKYGTKNKGNDFILFKLGGSIVAVKIQDGY